MIPIQSSNIAAAGPQPNGDLWVKFHNGSVYAYKGVEPSVVQTLLFDTQSAGRYFNRTIRSGPYEYRKLTDEEITTQEPL